MNILHSRIAAAEEAIYTVCMYFEYGLLMLYSVSFLRGKAPIVDSNSVLSLLAIKATFAENTSAYIYTPKLIIKKNVKLKLY